MEPGNNLRRELASFLQRSPKMTEENEYPTSALEEASMLMGLSVQMTTSYCAGTSLMGYVSASYDELVRLFGEPNSSGDEYKVDVEWMMLINGEPVTIYNYKDGPNYLGKTARHPKYWGSYDWHIGGKKKHVVDMVEELLQTIR